MGVKYSWIEYKGIYNKANWQDLLSVFNDNYDLLSLRSFRGSSEPPTTDEYTIYHWMGKNNKIGFGSSMISNADDVWDSFSFRFYDTNDEGNRYIKIDINRTIKELTLIGSLDNIDKLEEALNKILKIFDIQNNSLKKRVSDSSTFLSEGELEQKFKILYSQPQEQKDFELFCKNLNKFFKQISVLFIDIDKFKDLNNDFTETIIDDTILPNFQKIIRNITLYRGKVYRHGGDEFVVILPNHNDEESYIFAERLRKTIENIEFKVDNKHVKITVSIGLSIYPDHGESFNNVLKAANHAEHQAKKKGYNRVIKAQQ